MNGKPVPFKMKANDEDQHVAMRVSASGKSALNIRLHNDFNVGDDATLPALGAHSRGLRILSQTWTPSRDVLALELSGISGAVYELAVDGRLASVEGGELLHSATEAQAVRVPFTAGDPGTYTKTKIVFHFSPKPNKR